MDRKFFFFRNTTPPSSPGMKRTDRAPVGDSGKNALKQKALKVLQQRKMYDSQREQLQQQSWNMEQAGMMQDNLKSCSSS